MQEPGEEEEVSVVKMVKRMLNAIECTKHFSQVEDKLINLINKIYVWGIQDLKLVVTMQVKKEIATDFVMNFVLKTSNLIFPLFHISWFLFIPIDLFDYFVGTTLFCIILVVVKPKSTKRCAPLKTSQVHNANVEIGRCLYALRLVDRFYQRWWNR